MKKYVYLLTAAAVAISFTAKAQDDVIVDKSKDKEKHKPKEIIIKEDKEKGKTVVVIDEDGNVTVNGKSASDWDGGKITILPDNRDDIFYKKLELDDDMAGQAMKFKVLTDRFDAFGVRLGVYSSENEKGAEITQVTDSSAAFKAGLKVGDIITKVDNTPISNPEALSKAIRSHQVGDAVSVHYLRGDKEELTKVTLEKPKDLEFKELVMRPGMKLNFNGYPGFYGRPRLGANIQDTEDSTGVKVIRVNPESPAAKAGLQKDDVITSIDGKKVRGVDDAMEALRGNEDKYNYPVTVSRGGSSLSLQVKIPRDLKVGTL